MPTYEVWVRMETSETFEVEAESHEEAAEKFEYPRDEEYETMLVSGDFDGPIYEVEEVFQREEA